MSKNVEVLSHEALECLIGIIKQMVTLPKEVIDNLNLSDITTFSSTKIDALLTQTLTDANTHAEELCSTLTKLTCEKTTIQPTLENSKINIIYLYSADGTAPFQQYLKINTTELIDMGSTDIGLDEYLTITEAVKTYCTITDYETLKNEVVAVKNTIGTETLATTATTLKGAINELESKHYLEVFDLQGASVLDYAKTFNALTHNYFYANNCADLPNNMNYGYCSVDVSQDPLYRDITFYCPTTGRIYVNTIGADPDDATVFGTWSGWHEFLMKEDIVATIDSTSTDNQVPSAKVVYEKLEEINTNFQGGVNTIYDSVVEKGVTPVDKSPSEIADAISKLGGDLTSIYNALSNKGLPMAGAESEDQISAIISDLMTIKSFTTKTNSNTFVFNGTKYTIKDTELLDTSSGLKLEFSSKELTSVESGDYIEFAEIDKTEYNNKLKFM